MTPEQLEIYRAFDPFDRLTSTKSALTDDAANKDEATRSAAEAMALRLTQLEAELKVVSEFAERLLRVHECRSVDEAKAIVWQVRQTVVDRGEDTSTSSIVSG
jgi:hypothetical protein